MDNFATGSQDGTGASIDIDLGWTPDHVIVLNTEASDFAELRWASSMTNAHAVKRVTSTFTKITSLGITPLGNETGATKRGFRIGADADVNVSGETLQWFAFRNAEPRRA